MFENSNNEEGRGSKMLKSKGAIAATVAAAVLGGASAEAGKVEMFKELDKEVDNMKKVEEAPANPSFHKEKSDDKEDMFSDMDAFKNLQKEYATANESKRNDIRKEIARVLIVEGKSEKFLKENKTINLKSGDFNVIAQLVGETVVGVIKDSRDETSDFHFSLK